MTSATASQTVGPYWHLLEDPSWADLTRFGAQGERITLTGAVLDGDGKPCADACVEIWQSDPPASDSFPGFGRSNTDAQGQFLKKRRNPAVKPFQKSNDPYMKSAFDDTDDDQRPVGQRVVEPAADDFLDAALQIVFWFFRMR